MTAPACERPPEPEADTITVAMGEVAVAKAPTKLRTILGSCIGIVLYDRKARVGGLAHVVLPDSRGQKAAPGKFADTAVPHLLAQLVKAGGTRANVTARLAGGANMFRTTSANNIGQLNQLAVRQLLHEAGITVSGEDLGGDKGRRMTLDTLTGEVRVEVPGVQSRTL